MKTTLTSTIASLLFTYSLANADPQREQLEADLFTVRTPQGFELTKEQASSAGIHQQVILEATFLYYVDTENYKGIISLHEKFQEHLEKFDLDKSKIFATKEQWQSVIEYSLALKALENEQEDTFKKHITEAFWLSPETASAFSHHITTVRNKKIMANITISPERGMLILENQNPVSFKNIIKDNDALVLRFWSPWNQQIDTTYPYIINAAQQCSQNKIAFASVLTGSDKALIDSAKDIINTNKPVLPSQWLIDSNVKSFAKQLRIADLPTVIIITKDGKITYHGSASNTLFWQNLTAINPKIKQPNISN